MRTVVLVDGDPIVYRCGFAAQHTIVHALVETPTGAVEPWRFEGRADRNAWLKEHEGYEIVDESEELQVEPLSFVLQTVKQCLAPLETMGHLSIYLTGSGNFREKLATIVPYKFARRDTPRPVHYQAIRDYLVERWGAIVIDAREADDEISIRAHACREKKIPYVVATIDKDLDQIPGHHYDYAQHVQYVVSPEEAEKFFWQQALSGDPTDSIPGCYRIGKGKAKKLVDTWFEEKVSQRRLWELVVEQYMNSTSIAKCPYKLRHAQDAALETARLVWMQTEPGALWNPPGIPFGRVEGNKDDA